MLINWSDINNKQTNTECSKKLCQPWPDERLRIELFSEEENCSKMIQKKNGTKLRLYCHPSF